MMPEKSPISQILDLARWAPSGDNTQPWRFVVQDDTRFIIHGFDTRDRSVYDLDGHPSQLALGALIETIKIAASMYGYSASVVRRTLEAETPLTFDVTLHADTLAAASKLATAIPARSVVRSSYSIRQLTVEDKRSLERALEPGYSVIWFEGLYSKWQLARLMFANAKLRLTMQEAYRVHSEVIHWGRRFSPTKIPDQALGVDGVTLRLMRWILQDWDRVLFFNRYFAGTWMPRIQMDLIPSLRCGAHFAITRQTPAVSIDDYISDGGMVQRLWLTATTLGIMHQPELTPLIFYRYVQTGLQFSASAAARTLALNTAKRTAALLGADHSKIVWLGRLGYAPAARSRSTRRSLSELSTGTAP